MLTTSPLPHQSPADRGCPQLAQYIPPKLIHMQPWHIQDFSSLFSAVDGFTTGMVLGKLGVMS